MINHERPEHASTRLTPHTTIGRMVLGTMRAVWSTPTETRRHTKTVILILLIGLVARASTAQEREAAHSNTHPWTPSAPLHQPLLDLGLQCDQWTPSQLDQHDTGALPRFHHARGIPAAPGDSRVPPQSGSKPQTKQTAQYPTPMDHLHLLAALVHLMLAWPAAMMLKLALQPRALYSSRKMYYMHYPYSIGRSRDGTFVITSKAWKHSSLRAWMYQPVLLNLWCAHCSRATPTYRVSAPLGHALLQALLDVSLQAVKEMIASTLNSILHSQWTLPTVNAVAAAAVTISIMLSRQHLTAFVFHSIWQALCRCRTNVLITAVTCFTYFPDPVCNATAPDSTRGTASQATAAGFCHPPAPGKHIRSNMGQATCFVAATITWLACASMESPAAFAIAGLYQLTKLPTAIVLTAAAIALLLAVPGREPAHNRTTSRPPATAPTAPAAHPAKAPTTAQTSTRDQPGHQAAPQAPAAAQSSSLVSSKCSFPDLTDTWKSTKP